MLRPSRCLFSVCSSTVPVCQSEAVRTGKSAELPLAHGRVVEYVFFFAPAYEAKETADVQWGIGMRLVGLSEYLQGTWGLLVCFFLQWLAWAKSSG